MTSLHDFLDVHDLLRLRGRRLGKRVEYPPSRSAIGVGSPVLSVALAADEDVVWHWTHFMDGRSVVTGYSIVKREKAPLKQKK